MNEKLAVIIAGMNEFPRVIYTIRSVYEELRGRANFEIIYVDNFPDVLDKWNQGRVPDESCEMIKGSVKHFPNLRVLEYRDHLSHWVCKRKAVEFTDADFFIFLDAHVIPSRDSIFNQWEYYRKHHEELNGSLHLPTTYKILEDRWLQYRLVNDLDKGYISYSFTGYRPGDGKPYCVPCHTTDGCMMSRNVYNAFGGWPEIMQAWGGGENLFNFVMSVLGMNKWIFPGNVLYHDGAKRGYSYNWDGLHLVNRLIAMYMIGGLNLAERYIIHQEGDRNRNFNMYYQIVSAPEIIEQRRMIAEKQVIDIETWAKNWRDAWI